MNRTIIIEYVELSIEKILLMKMQRKNLYKQYLLEKRETNY